VGTRRSVSERFGVLLDTEQSGSVGSEQFGHGGIQLRPGVHANADRAALSTGSIRRQPSFMKDPLIGRDGTAVFGPVPGVTPWRHRIVADLNALREDGSAV